MRTILSALVLSATLLSSSIFAAEQYSATEDEITISRSAADAPKETSGAEWTLPPVVTHGTAAEAAKYDPIVPALQGETQQTMSTGNVVKSLDHDLPFHFNSNMKPGNQVGFMGTGKGSEETDVNVLGIPLNGAQGGGADLSIFPQFFWSGYTYQVGPSLGAYDPRGISGSLNLRLWTQENLGYDTQRLTMFASSRDIQQFSYGVSSLNHALLVGGTTGVTEGPAVSYSGKLLQRGSTLIRGHLIVTDNLTKDFASEKSGALTAQQRTVRVIPVLQLDQDIGDGVWFKSAFFYDRNFIRYEDLAQPRTSKSIANISQIGNESTLVIRDTKVGLGLRHVTYERSNMSYKVPTEQIINLQATQTMKSGVFTLEPTAGATLVSSVKTPSYTDLGFTEVRSSANVGRFGIYPFATLGGRADTAIEGGAKAGAFGRIGFHKRFPSLLDRYYSGSFPAGPTTTLTVQSNPNLEPESVRSVEAGGDYHYDIFKTQLTLFMRDYKHARYTRSFLIRPFPTVIGFQIVNQGDAYSYGAIHSMDLSPTTFLDLGTRFMFTKSKIEEINLQFPYVPEMVGVFKVDLHEPEKKFGIAGYAKAADKYYSYSESSGSSATRAPGYFYLDGEIYGQISKQIRLTGGVENIFGRKIQYRIGQADIGRVYTLAATATL